MSPFNVINDNDEGHFGAGPRSDLNGAYLMMGRTTPKSSSQNRSRKYEKSGGSSGLHNMRPDTEGNMATIGAARRTSTGDDEESGSLHSQADIIRRDVRWDITYDTPKGPTN